MVISKVSYDVNTLAHAVMTLTCSLVVLIYFSGVGLIASYCRVYSTLKFRNIP